MNIIIEKIRKEWNRLLRRLGLAGAETAGTTSAPAQGTDGSGRGETSAADPVPAPAAVSLDFRFGGFDGSKAVEDASVQIGAVRMKENGMTYRFTRGDLSAWGLEKTEAGALACAFYWDDAARKWIGGKFDWISTSRLSRSWENIRAHYHGWNDGAFFGAKRRAFCIVSKDGKRRTNLAEDGQ